jgi:3-hydroxymyristoyl/3-hydroxydecanoyl-(acyl carrier protein) dehydratase
MPQILVLEALAQAAGVLCHFSGLTAGMSRLIIFFAGSKMVASAVMRVR